MIKEFMSSLWGYLSSTTFSVILLLITAAYSILGTVIPQKESPQVYIKLYGEIFTKFFYFLNWTDIFGSITFRILLTILGLSLFSCSTKRFILALKGKLNLYMWGSFLAHLSILLIFVGAIYGSMFGFLGTAAINKGSMYFEPHGSFFIKLNDFNAKFDKFGRPLDFTSDLSIFENNKEVLRKTIYVNNPLEYKGIKLYQSSYGLNGFLGVTQDRKTEIIPIYKGSCAVFSKTGQMFLIEELFPDISSIHGSEIKTYEPIMPIALIYAHDERGFEEIGWITQSNSVKWKNYNLKLGSVTEYTGLQIKKDPGVLIVYFGFLVLVVGLGVMLYVKH